MSLWQALKYESDLNHDFSDDIKDELEVRLKDVLNNSAIVGKTASGATLRSFPLLQVEKEDLLYTVSIIQRSVNDTTEHIENIIKTLQEEIASKAPQFKIQIIYNAQF